MILIAHRGNTNGPNPEMENHPDYIQKALDLGFHCEIDVWWDEGLWHLGHDEQQYLIDKKFLVNARLWCHAKNFNAYTRLVKDPLIHCFWHQNDDYVLTNRGYIWTYPGKRLSEKSICVMPEWGFEWEAAKLTGAAGVCTDYIEQYR